MSCYKNISKVGMAIIIVFVCWLYVWFVMFIFPSWKYQNTHQIFHVMQMGQ